MRVTLYHDDGSQYGHRECSAIWLPYQAAFRGDAHDHRAPDAPQQATACRHADRRPGTDRLLPAAARRLTRRRAPGDDVSGAVPAGSGARGGFPVAGGAAEVMPRCMADAEQLNERRGMLDGDAADRSGAARVSLTLGKFIAIEVCTPCTCVTRLRAGIAICRSVR